MYVVLRVQCKRICGQQPLFLVYRGLVKWYDRGLQNLWWEFDSLIPCSLGAWKPLKSRHSGSFALSKKGRVPTLGLCQNPDKKEVARQRFLPRYDCKLEHFEQEMEMNYDEFVSYLLKKYGPAKYDYFTNATCKTKSKRISRTK